MKKQLFAFILIFALMLMSCEGNNNDKENVGGDNENADTSGTSREDGGDLAKNDGFILKANVNSTEEPGRIEVEVIESDYAFGVYWVLTNSSTEFCDFDGTKISSADIKSGDTVKITYGGQVMMSYPPQIVASQIQKVK